MKLTLALAVTLAAPASSPPPVGGSITVLAFRSPPARQLSSTRAVDLLLATQLVEPILALDEGPALARVVERSPEELVLEPRPGGFVGERPLELADLERLIAALARPGSAGAYCVLPIAGALARIGGDPSAALGLRAADGRLHLRLEAPYPHAEHLLAALATALPSSPDPADALPTGPFRPAGWPAAELRPDPRHRDGRPFLDAVLVLRVQTPFGARSEERRRPHFVSFGLPSPKAGEATRSQRVPPRGHPATELVFLAAGHKSDLPIDVLHSLGAALPLERLAEREWSGETEPSPSVRRGASSVLVVERRLGAARSATLTYLEEEGPGRRLIERLQLDLLRLGVSARLEPLDRASFETKRRSRSFDLMVLPLTLEGSTAPREVHELHRLLALAAAQGVLPRVLEPGALSRFASSSGEARRGLLEALERELLRAARLVPLVRRDLETRVSPGLEGVRVRAFGVPDLSSALIRPEEAPL